MCNTEAGLDHLTIGSRHAQRLRVEWFGIGRAAHRKKRIRCREYRVDRGARRVRIGDQAIHVRAVTCSTFGCLLARVGHIRVGLVEHALGVTFVDDGDDFCGKATIIGSIDVFEIQLAIAQYARALAEAQKV